MNHSSDNEFTVQTTAQFRQWMQKTATGYESNTMVVEKHGCVSPRVPKNTMDDEPQPFTLFTNHINDKQKNITPKHVICSYKRMIFILIHVYLPGSFLPGTREPLRRSHHVTERAKL